MAVRFHSSNRVEKLQQNLCYQLTDNPLANPLDSEIIVVPTFAMSRWLNLRLAEDQGIAANIEYPSPAGWLWQVARQVIDDLPDTDPLAADVMAWNCFRILPELTEQAEFSGIRRYLEDDTDGIKRWQLCQRVAEVFDRYQQYRPQMIRDWSSQKVSDWQAVLWRALTKDLQGLHRVDILDRLIARLNRDDPVTDIPQRASLFAISSLPPLTLEVLVALSRHMEITFYQHSPTDQYFADLRSSRSLSKIQLSSPDEIGYYDTGNELLASWGRQAQAMQTLLLQHDYAIEQEIEYHLPPGNSTLLQSIQQSIFDLNTTPFNSRADGSIDIHICHSAMRECQVLHDQLLNRLNENPQLTAEDILVMVPEISRYAPYIEAVFGYEDKGDKPYLPWNLSDISIIDDHPLVQSFLQLLNLPASRFEISEIMSLLQVAEIRQHFELDETALDDITQWLEASLVRWGIDGRFKLEIGLPATVQNTWLQARDRLLIGYAMGNDMLWKDIAGLNHVDSSNAVNIAKFLNLFERLNHWRNQLGHTAPASGWITTLNALIDDFYSSVDSSENLLQDIRNSIDELYYAGDCEMSIRLTRHWLETSLSRQQRQGRLFSGGVTFCGMRPMRNLPYPVICLLGMNGNAFPRKPVHYDFDKLNHHYRAGDPTSADEDRYLMLETLLCARQHFYISYTGRSLKDNSECQPSVLVNELIDFIDSHSFIEDNQPELSQQITQLHPMQVFSADNFASPLFSYDSLWCDAAERIRAGSPSTEVDWPPGIKTSSQPEPGHIDCGELKQFLPHPIRYFFNTRLKIYSDDNAEYINDENFIIDGLTNWQIRSQIADYILKGQSDYQTLIEAEGLLPHGGASTIILDNFQQQYDFWLKQIERYSNQPRETILISISLDSGIRISGEVATYYPGKGLMHYSPSRLNGQSLLKLWVDHLCICIDKNILIDKPSYLIAIDQTIAFKNIEPTKALGYLSDLCDLFQQGQTDLLPVFPKSSFAFALEDNPEKALKAALNVWQSSRFSPVKGDENDFYIQLALRNSGQIPIQLPAFASYAARLYRAALSHRIVS